MLPFERPYVPDLPVELYAAIVGMLAKPHSSHDPLDTTETLLSLSLCTRRLRSLTVPHLFSSLSLCAYDDGDFEQLKPFNRFCSALMSTEPSAVRLSRHVKSVRLQFSYETIPGDSEWPKFRRLLANYLKTLSLLPNLTHLTFADTPVAPELLSDILQKTKVSSLTLSGCVAAVEPTGSGYSVIIDYKGLRQLANVISTNVIPNLTIQSEMWTALPAHLLTHPPSSPLTSFHLSTCEDVDMLRTFLIETPSLLELSISQVTASPLYESGLNLPEDALPHLQRLEFPSQWVPQLLSRQLRHLDLRPRLRNGLKSIPIDADVLIAALNESKKLTSLSLPYTLASHPWAKYTPDLRELSVCLADADILGNDSSEEIQSFFVKFVEGIGIGSSTATEDEKNIKSTSTTIFPHVHTFKIAYPDYRRRLSSSFLVDLQAQRRIVRAITSRCPSATTISLSSVVTWSRAVQEDDWKAWVVGKEKRQLKRSLPRFLGSDTWRVRDYRGCLRGLFDKDEEAPKGLLQDEHDGQDEDGQGEERETSPKSDEQSPSKDAGDNRS